VFFFSLLAAMAGAAAGVFAPRVPQVANAVNQILPPAVDPAGAQILAQTPQIDQRLQAVERVVNGVAETASAGGGDPANAAARVFALQATVAEVQSRLAAIPSPDQITTLTTEVQRLQTEIPAIQASAAAATRAAEAAFAVAAVDQASRKSGPFEADYATLVAMLPENPDVVALEPLAKTGAPTLIELRDQFATLDNEIVRAGLKAQAGAGFVGRVQSTMSQWITVRRVDQVGDSADAIVARASARLDAQDIAGAVGELETLQGAPREVAGGWIDAARRRMDIDTRLGAVRAQLARRS
jgi:hypothetical protein